MLESTARDIAGGNHTGITDKNKNIFTNQVSSQISREKISRGPITILEHLNNNSFSERSKMNQP